MGQKQISPEEQRKNAILKQIIFVLVVIMITITVSVLITKAVSDRNVEDTSAAPVGMDGPTNTDSTTKRPNIPRTDSESTGANTERDIDYSLVTEATTAVRDFDYKKALREYVQKDDPTYAYQMLPEHTTRGINDNSTILVLNMTSQTWNSEDLVGNANIWWHYMVLTIPDEMVYEDTALIFVTQGDNTNSPPDPTTSLTIQLATQWAELLGMVVATVFQVPNQPIKFAEEDVERTEDDIIAFTWRYFMTSSPEDPTILLQMPMTKIRAKFNGFDSKEYCQAVVRAMDTVTNVVNSRINRFYLTGISKRAWVVWSTAAVDDRVVGVVPQVFDMLNMRTNLDFHYQSLNGWTFILTPYFKENITLYLDHPNFALAQQVMDPFSLRDDLAIPKYIIIGGNDEFFLPDNSHNYYDELPGPTYLRIHPNVGHNLSPRTAFVTSEVTAFILSIEEKWPLPELSWTRSENETHGEIKVTVQAQSLLKITAYRATTPNDERRDFRLHFLGNRGIQPSLVTYEEFNVTQTESDEYVATLEKPETGWTCFFVEMEFQAAKGQILRFTSEVNIIPNTFPSEPCSGVECFGSLV